MVSHARGSSDQGAPLCAIGTQATRGDGRPYLPHFRSLGVRKLLEGTFQQVREDCFSLALEDCLLESCLLEVCICWRFVFVGGLYLLEVCVCWRFVFVRGLYLLESCIFC